MKLLILLAILFVLLPAAWRHRIVRRALFFVSAFVLGLGGVHLVAVTGILVYSLLHESRPLKPLHASAIQSHP